MIRSGRAFAAGILALLFFNASAQSKKLPNTFLWRITGNGLRQPSYVFGSMHVKDRRVFQFTDSLYHFLETVEGYAMEIDPDEAMAAVFKTLTEPDNSPLLKDEMKSGDFKKIAKDLEQKYGVPAERITKKQAWLYKKGLEGQCAKATDMDAVIDLYLYQIAKQSGKWVGGIEDVEDQLNLVEAMKVSFEASDLVESRMATGNSVEKLLQIYLAQDLTKMDAVVNAMPAGSRDSLLLKRNHKMARRMDSLARIGSQFFTVGAAHLPGTEGVLQLLQERGFTVTPVFSNTKIAPEKYTYVKKEPTWQAVTTADTSYRVEMPGKPNPLSMDGINTMQIYADLGTGLIYFAAGFPIPAAKNMDSLLKATSKRFMVTSRLKGAPQPIVYNGLKGIEAVKDSGQYTFRMRLLPNGSQLVMLMMGSEKQARLYGEEAQHFFNSLAVSAPKIKECLPKEAWHRYTNERWGVQVLFPDAPQPNTVMQKSVEKRDVTHAWNFMNQTALDVNNNTYYMLISRETSPGMYILDDNTLFEESKNKIENGGDISLTRYDTGRWNGLPAMWMEGNYKKQDLRMKALTVNRGNRAYLLMVVFDKTGDSSNADFYINSLQLSDSKKAVWQSYTDPLHRFSTRAPQPLRVKEPESATSTYQTVIAHDSLSAQSYQVQIEPVPLFFWAANDSSLYAGILQQYRADGDSVLFSKSITAGAAPGYEFKIRTANKRNIKWMRVFPNGDSLYLIYLVAPDAFVTNPDAASFFDNFQFTAYRKPKRLFQNHTDVLLTQLHATDSATFAAAKDFINRAPFTTADVPQLHQAMLQLYPDWDSTFSDVQNTIFGKAIDLDADGTVRFIEQHYATLTGDREALQYRMLIGLATIKTAPAYGLLKKLLTTALPKAGSSGGLASALSDSLALTRTLFPEVLAQAGDSLLHQQLVYIINALLDSNLLQPAVIAPYSDLFVKRAQALWQTTLQDEDAGWQLYESITLLKYLNTTRGNALLQEILKARYLGLKEAAIVALLRNNQPVAQSALLAVAADRYNRIALYGDLKKLGKLSLFPAAYRNQKSIAESGLYQVASDDYTPSKMTYVGTRTAMYNGSKKLFYLWKVQYGEPSETYLGISGPYDSATAPLNENPDFATVLNDGFDASKIDEQLKAFLLKEESAE